MIERTALCHAVAIPSAILFFILLAWVWKPVQYFTTPLHAKTAIPIETPHPAWPPVALAAAPITCPPTAPVKVVKVAAKKPAPKPTVKTIVR